MKRLAALFLCLLLAAGTVPVEVFAQEQENGELFDQYVMGLFYEDEGVAPVGDLAREQLGKPARKLYDHLKELIVKVAAGQQSETSCTVTLEQILEWGGSGCYPGGNIDEAMNACIAEFEVDAVIEALLHDCPYELYWYDKVSGCNYWFVMMPEDGGFSVVGITFTFQVVRDHQAKGSTAKAPKVRTDRAAAAVAAAGNARALVAEFAGKGDYAKLKAYKNEICELVSYNDSAAYHGYFSQDADPWQLVYVFDGNSSTNVVCEGYSKAFQYLCDQSKFKGTVKCYSVSGWASSDSGGEPHMWNIVSIGGKQYLADITNSDAGTIGVEGNLFLAGASGSVTGGYRTGGMFYDYDICTEELWGTGSGSILKLASSRYDPNAVTNQKISAPKIKASNKADSGKPQLTWEKVKGAVKYQVYRATSKNGKYTLMKTVTGTGYVNANAKAGKLYYYKVRAVDESGKTSGFSNIVSRTCDLARPSITVKRNDAGKPRISWQKVEGAVKYEVYRATSKNGKYTKLVTTKNLYQVNKNAKAGVTYYYKVKAIHSNTNANSALSLPKYIKAK